MPSLKDYRDRIASVKSTKKITSAMKMVAASKLKKAQDHAEASQPYATRMANMLTRVASNIEISETSSPLIAGTGADDKYLLIVVTSDRGLCGGFNINAAKAARQKIKDLQAAGKKVEIVCVGRKGRDVLKREFGDMVIESIIGLGGKKLSFEDADTVNRIILDRLEAGEMDKCMIIYNEFKSVIAQVPVVQQLVPFAVPETQDNKEEKADDKKEVKALYDFEPEEEELLAELLPKNLAIQVFRSLLDSAAGEQAARMTAMDNATRNAGDKINELTLTYNRARQAYITKELIEIISGAEAV